jgi:hypothetical protein
MDDAFRRNLAAEAEIDAIFDAQDAKYLRQIVALQDEKGKAVQEKKRAMQEKKVAEQQKKKAEEKAKTALVKLARIMKATGASSDQIQQETGLIPEQYE